MKYPLTQKYAADNMSQEEKELAEIDVVKWKRVNYEVYSSDEAGDIKFWVNVNIKSARDSLYRPLLRRVAACLNLCRGLATPFLEQCECVTIVKPEISKLEITYERMYSAAYIWPYGKSTFAGYIQVNLDARDGEPQVCCNHSLQNVDSAEAVRDFGIAMLKACEVFQHRDEYLAAREEWIASTKQD
jgi:hypothetical protein